MPKRRKTPPLPDDEIIVIHVRLPRDLVKQIDHLAVDRETFRAETVEFLIREGLEEMLRHA